jgi:hypothetical protein
LKKGDMIGYGYDILDIPKIRILYPQNIPLQKWIGNILLPIFECRIGYKYPSIYILPVSAAYYMLITLWADFFNPPTLPLRDVLILSPDEAKLQSPKPKKNSKK